MRKVNNQAGDGGNGISIFRLTATRKVQFAFVVIVVLVLIVGIFIYLNMNDLQSRIAKIKSRSIPAAKSSVPVEKKTIETRLGIYKWVIGEGELKEVKDSLAEIEESLIEEKGLITDKELQNKLDQILKKHQQYKTALENYTLSNDSKYYDQMQKLGFEITELTKKSRLETWENVNQDMAYLTDQIMNIKQKILIFTLGCLLFGVIIGFIISKNLSDVTDKIQQAASVTLEEAEEAKRRANTMTNSAHKVEDYIHNAHNAVAEMDENIEEVNFATNQVSDSISNISSTMEDLSHMSQTVLNSIEDIQKRIEIMNNKVTTGQEIVDQVVEAMMALNEKIKDIEKMSTMIMDITEQTNLLSLNAAIEAARAGQDGKGFAVVAEEIQELAHKSGQAAEHIEKVVFRIRKAANETVETMVANDDNFESRSSESVEGIFTAVSKGVKDINAVIDGVLESTEDQAAGNEEVTASAQEISASAEEVSSQIEKILAASRNLEESISHIVESNDELLNNIKAQFETSKYQLKLTEAVVKANNRLK